MSKSKRGNSGNNLSTKIILMVEVILLISSTLFCSVSVYRERTAIRKAIQQRMLDIANCASGSVNGDVIKTFTKDKVGSKEYNDIYNTLAVFRDNVELEYVYITKETPEGYYVFTMDLDPEDPASYGDLVEYTDALGRAGDGIPSVDEISYTDQWGRFYSSYSPVYDSAGEIVGVIGVDFSAEWFEDQLTSQMRSTIISYLIIFMISMLVAAALSLSTVRPFVKYQGKLLEEKMRAESANNAKSEFLANMSHEIRTPINVVLGMNEMILRETRGAQQNTEKDDKDIDKTLNNVVVYASDVENAGHNLLALVNDILDFSKIEAGRMDLVEAPYKLSSMLGNISNMLRYKAQDKKLDLIFDVDKTIPDELKGDEIRVRQVLVNILNNAVKYTEKGSVIMTLKGEREDDRITLVAAIEDTGIGIREEDKEKLFSKFERLEMERNSTVEGTGLGLVITKRLLDMMGGDISVESEYGSGSVFTVRIPQTIVSEEPIGDFKAHYEAGVQENKVYKESFRAPRAKVLVVDDTKINLTVVKHLLKNTKMIIETASSGKEGVSMAEKTEYDVILMDQRMPEMNGTEALHRIRSTAGAASVVSPVICLTADAVVGARDRYMAEGFSDYITKPVDGYELEKMLMKYLPKDKMVIVREKTGE